MLNTHGLAGISVSELCEKADVSRSTFYSHYGSVQDCFEEISDGIIGELEEELKRSKCCSLKEFLRAYLYTILRHQEVFRQVHNSSISNPLIAEATRLSGVYCHTDFFVPSGTENLRMSYHLFGFFGIIHAWLNNGCGEKPDDIIEIIFNLYPKEPEG